MELDYDDRVSAKRRAKLGSITLWQLLDATLAKNALACLLEPRTREILEVIFAK